MHLLECLFFQVFFFLRVHGMDWLTTVFCFENAFLMDWEQRAWDRKYHEFATGLYSFGFWGFLSV
jgi:hypothetical protein